MVNMDRLGGTIIGELYDVFIRLSSNLMVTQAIDIYVFNILDMYGMLLIRDWSFQLHGYFSTNYSHPWLPHKSKEN